MVLTSFYYGVPYSAFPFWCKRKGRHSTGRKLWRSRHRRHLERTILLQCRKGLFHFLHQSDLRRKGVGRRLINPAALCRTSGFMGRRKLAKLLPAGWFGQSGCIIGKKIVFFYHRKQAGLLPQIIPGQHFAFSLAGGACICILEKLHHRTSGFLQSPAGTVCSLWLFAEFQLRKRGHLQRIVLLAHDGPAVFHCR